MVLITVGDVWQFNIDGDPFNHQKALITGLQDGWVSYKLGKFSPTWTLPQPDFKRVYGKFIGNYTKLND